MALVMVNFVHLQLRSYVVPTGCVKTSAIEMQKCRGLFRYACGEWVQEGLGLSLGDLMLQG